MGYWVPLLLLRTLEAASPVISILHLFSVYYFIIHLNRLLTLRDDVANILIWTNSKVNSYILMVPILSNTMHLFFSSTRWSQCQGPGCCWQSTLCKAIWPPPVVWSWMTVNKGLCLSITGTSENLRITVGPTSPVRLPSCSATSPWLTPQTGTVNLATLQHYVNVSGAQRSLFCYFRIIRKKKTQRQSCVINSR